MIEIDQLTKRYGRLTAVDGLSFTVEPGQVLGFLGPNGAGKSTTMKMIVGFLTPTSGRAEVCGFDVQRQPIAAKRVMGYLPEGAPSYGEMTTLQFLQFISDARGLTGETRRRRIHDVVERLQLQSVLQRTIDTLSKGFRRRVGLGQAILHDPPVLILDEPTDGLDPNQKHEVRTLIEDMASDKIIVISTHILEEVQAVCDRAIIIAHGRIVADDTPAALEARSRYNGAVTLRLALGQSANLDDVQRALGGLEAVASVEADPRAHTLVAFPKAGQDAFAAVSQAIHQAQWPVVDLRVEAGRLDEVFRQITAPEKTQEIAA